MGSATEGPTGRGEVEGPEAGAAEVVETDQIIWDDVADEDWDPRWWHRDHPVFSAVAGFYAGIVSVTVLPALYVGVLRSVGTPEQVERYFWWLLLVLLVPAWLVLSGRSRRGGLYMVLGMVVTLAVVLGVGFSVLWVMSR